MNIGPLASLPKDGPESDAAAVGPDPLLGLLAAVENEPDLSQRSLAMRMGTALGLTNAYLRRAVRKGWIKVRQAPARRYFYYLTPKGFAEKTRLTQQYLSDSFRFFRRARAECEDLYRAAATQGHRRILLCGSGELAEIATLAASESGVELVGILDPSRNEPRYCGLSVWRDLGDTGAFDAILLTDVRAPQDTHDRLAAQLPPERLLVPRLLHVSRLRAPEGAVR